MKKVVLIGVISVILLAGAVLAVNCISDNNIKKLATVNGQNNTEGNKNINLLSNLMNGSGKYNGRIDSNFIEIEVDGESDINATRSFMLSEKVKNEFDNYKLKTKDSVVFSYQLNQNNQGIIEKIEKAK